MAGSLGLLVGGLIVSVTALPAVANVSSPVPAVVTTVAKTEAVTKVTTTTVAKPVAVAKGTTIAKVRAVTKVTTTTVAKPVAVAKVTTVAKVRAVTKVTTTTVAKPVEVAKVTTSFNNAVPAANIAPSPNFLVSSTSTFVNGIWNNANPCIVGSATGISWPAFTDGQSCNDYVLTAINHARAREGVKPLVLPTNWYSLTTAQQLFVVADLERVDRGLPPYLGINSALSANAIHAAQTNNDPTVAAGFSIANDAQGYPAMGGAWSGGYSVLAADYFWMYADGWAGSKSTTANIACTSPRAAGCWAHRLELLGSDPGFNPGVGLGTRTAEMGVGFAMVRGAASYVDLIEVPAGTPPSMSFTWAANVAPFLG